MLLSVARLNILSPGEKAGQAHPVKPSGQIPINPGFNAMSKAERVQLTVTFEDLIIDPGQFSLYDSDAGGNVSVRWYPERG